MTRNIKWLIGAILIAIFALMVIFLPIPSLLGWQSEFLSRSFIWIVVSAFFCLYRVMRGPSAPDRAVAVDMLGILIVGLCAVLSITTGRDWYMDIGIAWALQSFIGIMALSKYLEGKDFDE